MARSNRGSDGINARAGMQRNWRIPSSSKVETTTLPDGIHVANLTRQHQDRVVVLTIVGPQSVQKHFGWFTYTDAGGKPSRS